MSRRWVVAVAALALLVLPDVAQACAVCFDPREENRLAFLATTIFLTSLPLAMVGGVLLWLRRRSKRRRGPASGEGAATPTEVVATD